MNRTMHTGTYQYALSDSLLIGLYVSCIKLLRLFWRFRSFTIRFIFKRLYQF